MMKTQKQKNELKTPSLKMKFLSALTAGSLLFPLAGEAGFVEDFYRDSAAQTSVTPAGIYTSSDLGLITGGRFVTKTPRQSFQLYGIDAPHLKAGCGGIDFYLGAFSIPSQDEFMSFLRSIGTALPGVAFQVALNAMAPELNETLAQYRDLLMSLSSDMGDSCQAAERLMDATGASTWLANTGYQARNYLRSSGRAEDAADAMRMTRTNGATTLSSVPERRTTGGSVAQAAEMNLTWALLKAGRSTARLPQEHLELLMTLVGSVIYQKTGSGDDTTVRQIPLAAQPLLESLIGTPRGAMRHTGIKVYRCDTEDRCLNPTLTETTDLNLSAALYSAMVHYRQSLLERNPSLVSEEELQHMAVISSIPLLAFVELTATPQAVSFSDSFMETYAEAAAYEAILAALSSLTEEVQQLVTGGGKDVNTIQAQYAKDLEARVHELTADIRRREGLLTNRMSRVADFIDEVSHLRRTLYGKEADTFYGKLPAGNLR